MNRSDLTSLYDRLKSSLAELIGQEGLAGRELQVRCRVLNLASVTPEAIAWCDRILAAGSTIVNGTITAFLDAGKPVVFFGVTIAAAAEILGLTSYCHAPAR